MKSLGFQSCKFTNANNHFDFTQGGRRILVIGPMGSGKTEYSARVWRDAAVARQKSSAIGTRTTTGQADRRTVYFIRSSLDKLRFPDYPEDALALPRRAMNAAERISAIFPILLNLNRHWRITPGQAPGIIDEASFYDERIAYVVKEASLRE